MAGYRDLRSAKPAWQFHSNTKQGAEHVLPITRLVQSIDGRLAALQLQLHSSPRLAVHSSPRLLPKQPQQLHKACLAHTTPSFNTSNKIRLP
jgi:hypothetical protein